MTLTFLICAILIFLVLFVGIIIYNRLIKNRNRMQEAWSLIDVFLKKRYELVPNLVEIVKGYSTHEQKLLEEVTRYRSETMKTTDTGSRIEGENRLEKALNNLIVTIENYPELKANEHFLKLQEQLVEIETDLERARRYYNGCVRENNIALESFPSNMIGNLFNFDKGIFFASDASERMVPDVSFNN